MATEEEWGSFFDRNPSDVVTSVLLRFYKSVRDPGTYQDSYENLRTGYRTDFNSLLEEYELDKILEENDIPREMYREGLEDIREGEGFELLETTDLYLNIARETGERQKAKEVLRRMEQNDVRSPDLREFSPLLRETVEERMED